MTLTPALCTCGQPARTEGGTYCYVWCQSCRIETRDKNLKHAIWLWNEMILAKTVARAAAAETRARDAETLGAEIVRRIRAANHDELLACHTNWTGKDGGGIMQPRCWHECGKIISHVGTHRCRRCGEDS